MCTSFGIDMTALEKHGTDCYPPVVPGRYALIDGDFIAYYVAKEEHPFEAAKKLEEHYADCVGAEHCITYTTIGPEKSYKFQQAIQKPYQANREKVERDSNVYMIKEYIGCQHPDENVWEADDLVSARAYEYKAAGIDYVIISPDKDLRMVPGKHYNFKTGDIDYVDGFGEIALVGSKLVGYGTKWFAAQLLMGDACDNIQGLPYHVMEDETKKKVGPVRAYRLLCNTSNDKEAMTAVSYLYALYDNFKDFRTGDNVSWKTAFKSEGQLLWTKRTLDSSDFIRWYEETMEEVWVND